MSKQAWTVAFAFVGLTVGAGFASGQEVLQYFVSFGINGLWGALLAAAIFSFAGMAIVQLGSYFLATNHNVVLAGVARPYASKIFDILITFTLFSIGFVMIAGGGSNLEQQFGLPTWVGSAIITAAVIAIGMLDVKRVTAVIGALTPVMVAFVVIAIIYSLTHIDGSWSELDTTARTITSTLPNWPLSALNYVSMALSLAVSMTIVMGGDITDPHAAGRGGLLGGMLFGILLVATTVALFANAPSVIGTDMPLLTLVNEIAPWLGLIMSFVIFAMIFNTAIGMYYALAKRFCQGSMPRFRVLLITLALIGFGLSFVGFTTLIGYLYPLIGYTGFFLIGLLIYSWIRTRSEIETEFERRQRIRLSLRDMLSPKRQFSAKARKRLEKDLEDSPADSQSLANSLAEELGNEYDDVPDYSPQAPVRFTTVDEIYPKDERPRN